MKVPDMSGRQTLLAREMEPIYAIAIMGHRSAGDPARAQVPHPTGRRTCTSCRGKTPGHRVLTR